MRASEAGTPLRILLVEHEAGDAELVRSTLEHAGFDVAAHIAATEAEFIRLLGTNDYDVVLADYRLPGWTGMDALARLRELGLEIPLILVTGTLGDEHAVECIKRGVSDYVLKDNLARLPVAIRRLLDERRERTARARNEDLIRKLTLAVDQSPASVVITDTSGIIEYVNRRFVEVTGYSAGEALGESPRLLRSGRNAPSLYHELWSTIRSGQAWEGELQNRRKTGEVYWDHVTVTPIRDASGAITHFLATQQDVTERKTAESALREREEQFRQLADNIKEVFFLMDARYRETLYINPAFEVIWGRSVRSLYENPTAFLDGVLEADRPRLLESIARTQQGEDAGEVEFRIVRPDGSVRWALAHAVPIRNDQGEVYRISGVVLDITERRGAQEALADSEALFRKLTDASFDGIDIVVDGVVRQANRGFAELFGYEPDDVIGRPVIDFVAEESVDDVQRRIQSGYEGRYEILGKRKDGRRLNVEITATLHTIDGRPAHISALRDITEKRLLEDQFRQAQKMEAVGRLAGGLAHDFNNLLTVITSYAELLLEGVATSDPRHDDLEQIRKAAEGAAALTRQLLAFSRQQIIQPRPVVLEDVVTNAEKLLKRLIGEDIELLSVLSNVRSTIVIDPGQLEQAIMNLAVNARDAMPTGGKLTIETWRVEFDAAYAQAHWPATPGRYVVLSMSDTGVGMDEATRARIFEPFFTTKEIGHGTGLGLATVYGIVKQSGGFIWVYSEPGQGATFKIYLPLSDMAHEKLAASGPVPDVARGTETVLLVEDAAAVRGAIRQILEHYGYRVIEAPNAKAALAYATAPNTNVQMLLTDVVMPEMSGRELAERFLALSPGIKVLFMSGYTDDAVVRHGVLASGVAYLQKPFSPEMLTRKLREVFDSART